jgi:hypothetical protein
MAPAWHTRRRLAVEPVDLVCCRQRVETEEAAVAPLCVFDVSETLLDRAARLLG